LIGRGCGPGFRPGSPRCKCSFNTDIGVAVVSTSRYRANSGIVW